MNRPTGAPKPPGISEEPAHRTCKPAFDAWAKQSYEIATKIAYRNGGRIGIGGADCTMLGGAAPVLPVGYVASARRIADR